MRRHWPLFLLLPACQLFLGGDDDGDVVAPIDAAPVPDARELIDARPIFDVLPSDDDASPCAPEVKTFATSAAPHVAEGTDVAYTTNPPSSGPHYPRWARWNETYEQPILPPEHWVHNLEHGGVVFLYDCDPGACPDLVAELEALQASLPADDKCVAPLRTRTLVARYLGLPGDRTIAAAAWGTTYTARCFDEASLRRFYQQNVAMGPENTCAQGTAP
jgi:hypothetical protein